MTKEAVYVGVGVAKSALDVAVRQTRMHCRQPLHKSGLTSATYSARNTIGKPWVTVALIAWQSDLSQLQIPPIKGVMKVHTV